MNSFTKLPNTNPFDNLLHRSTNTAYRVGQVGVVLKHTWQDLAHWMTTGSMPKITKFMEGDAEVWKVYDPVSNRTLYFDHEDTLRIWMDQRYYQ